MAANPDPYRTLGLAPGASLDEIRRAYRRLAKVNHPDAAGEAALPRFLAIQQAYEQLVGPNRGRRIGGRPGASPSGAAPDPAREPWRADPDRARASGRADRGRAAGARPAGPRPAGGRRSTGGTPGSGATGAAGTSGGAGAPAGDGSTTDDTGGRARRSGGRRRAANKATPGSTSYEGAENEPFEPGWSGATWYGTSSGTYWTINPKEYADPRKHGPEYQARARRAAAGGPVLEGATTSATGPAPESAAGPAPGARSTEGAPPVGAPPASGPPPGARPTRSGHVPPRSEAWSRRRAAADTGPAHDPEAAPAAEAADAGAPSWTPPQRDAGEIRFDADATASRRAAGAVPPPGDPPRGFRTWVDEAPDGRFRAPLLREPTTSFGRLAMALLGWPPLGLFAAAAIDQSTGCGRYAASCPEVSSPGTWILNAAILLLLLAVPRVAAWSAHGAIAALIIGIPTAVALSAGGGSNVPEASAPVLLGTLAIAYLAGVAYAILMGRSGARGARSAP